MLTRDETHWLLFDLCVQLGFCLPQEVSEQLETDPPSDVIAFTDAVFIGEGFDLDRVRLDLYRQVRDMVQEAFDRSISSS